MKKRNKIGLLAIALIGTAFAASSCTANFCTNIEKCRIAYALEPGVSSYIESETAPSSDSYSYVKQVGSSNVYQVVEMSDGYFTNSSQLNDIIKSAVSSGVYRPSNEYFYLFDEIVLEKAAAASNLDLTKADLTIDEVKSALKENGNLKYYSQDTNDNWGNYKAINNELRSILGLEKAASVDFENIYMSSINTTVDTFRSCITTYDGVEYGNYGKDKVTVKLDKVTWKEAWGKGGKLIEGLVVYPVAWLVDTFAHLFAGGKSASPEQIAAEYANGVPQLLSLILVTIIVRLFIFLVTIKSTLSQQKITSLQPELTKIQQKYPNANTNQSEKQRLAEEQMRLYKKNKVNPLSPLLTLIIQFPAFIGVWGAMTGSAVLSTGQFLNLDLSQSIWAALKMGPKSHPGWWTALVLIILMSVGQFFSMKIPQWIQKAKTKKIARLGKNPAQNSQNKTANIVSYVMLVMIIIMGFTLPAAMGVYWFIGAIVSLIQTILTQYVFTGKKRK